MLKDTMEIEVPVIVVEGKLWPVVFVGAVDDSSVVPHDAVIVTERLLEMSEALVLGVVVAGKGDAGVRAQRAAFRWLQSHEALVRSRALRLAWVIEDERLRACSHAWLECMGHTVFAVRSMTFRTVQTALSWLLDTPWPVGERLEEDVWMKVKAPTVAMSEPMMSRGL